MKKILKFNNRGGNDTTEFFRQLKDSHSLQARNVVAITKEFKEKAKKTKLELEKEEWLRLWQLDNKNYAKYVKDIEKCMDLIEVSEIESLLPNDFYSQETEYKNTISKKLVGLRKFLSQTQLKNDKYEELLADDKNEVRNEEMLCQKEKCSKNSFNAEFLIEIRNQFMNEWKEMCIEENNLFRGLNDIQIQISLMLSSRKNEENNLSFETLVSSHDDDDVTVNIFISEIKENYFKLIQDHEDDLLKLKNEFVSKCPLLDVSDETGGWSTEDHEKYLKINKDIKQQGLPGNCTKAKYKKYLFHLSDQEIREHDEWFRNYNIYKTKNKICKEKYLNQLQEFIEEKKFQLENVRIEQKQNRENEIALKNHQQYRELLHSKLIHLREKKEEEIKIIKLKEEKDQQTEQEILQKLKDEEDRKRENEKMLIAKFKEKREEELKIRKYKDEEERIKREEEIRLEIEQNRSNVEERQNLLKKRESERLKRQAEYEANEMRRMEMLLRVTQQALPYSTDLNEIESRLNEKTLASLAHENIRNIEKEKEERGRNQPLHGFEDKTIVSDARFRLTEALTRAGLHNSRAAREAISLFHPVPVLPISQVFNHVI